MRNLLVGSMAKRMVCALVFLSIVSALPAAGQTPLGGKDKGSAATSGKHPPQAKTQQEYVDYNTAYAIIGGAAMEKAANEFAAKYPNSELRSYLYSKAMHEYQNENNPEKMLTVGEKVLRLDPDNSIALVLTATVLADSLNDTDTDRQAKITRVKTNAAHALDT